MAGKGIAENPAGQPASPATVLSSLRLCARHLDEARPAQRYGHQSRLGRALRWFLVARSRCAEDALASAVSAGVRQYVVLGAGLDTFAYRNPHAAEFLRVFEVDLPATQAWKRTLLARVSIEEPASLTFVPVDFETQSLPALWAAASRSTTWSRLPHCRFRGASAFSCCRVAWPRPASRGEPGSTRRRSPVSWAGWALQGTVAACRID